jgi:hypothetical protein
LAVACRAAEPTAVAGGKDYLRSAVSSAGWPQQSPTAYSETFTSPPVVGSQEAEVDVVNEKSLRITILRPSGMGRIAGGHGFHGGHFHHHHRRSRFSGYYDDYGYDDYGDY